MSFPGTVSLGYRIMSDLFVQRAYQITVLVLLIGISLLVLIPSFDLLHCLWQPETSPQSIPAFPKAPIFTAHIPMAPASISADIASALHGKPEELENRGKVIAKRVDTYQQEIEAYKAQVTAYEREISNYTNQVSAYQTQAQYTDTSRKLRIYNVLVSQSLMQMLGGLLIAIVTYLFAKVADNYNRMKRGNDPVSLL